MSGYNGRRDEVMRAYQEIAPGLNANETARLGPGLTPLYDERDAALTALMEVVRSESNDPQAPVWKDRSNAASDRFLAPLSRLLDGVTDVQPATRVWVEALATRDAGFFDRLDATGAARARDGFQLLEQQLGGMIANLKTRWEKISDEAKRFEDAEADAARRLGELVAKAVRAGGDSFVRYKDLTDRLSAAFVGAPASVRRSIVDAAKEQGWPDALADAIPSMSSVGRDYQDRGKSLGLDADKIARLDVGKFRDAIPRVVAGGMEAQVGAAADAALDGLAAFYKDAVDPAGSGEFFDALSRYARGVGSETTVVSYVDASRREVDRFLRESGLDAARTIFEFVDAGLSRWASEAASDGLRTDAGAWASEARGVLKARFDRIADAFGRFVSDNSGRFIGAPSTAVENELIHSDVWQDRINNILDVGLDTRLKDWRSGLTVASDGVSFASNRALADLRALPSDINDYAKRAAEEWWDKQRERFARQTQDASSSLNERADKYNRSELDRQLNRSQIARMLRELRS